MASELISMTEAAAQLGVTVQRVHQRIQDGSLPAERIGRSWAIDPRDVRRASRDAHAGRPVSSRSAWAMLVVADGIVGVELSSAQRSRARSRLRNLVAHLGSDDVDEAIDGLRLAFRSRAHRKEMVAAAADLADLSADPRVQLSGVSLPESGIAAGRMVEGYVPHNEWPGVVDNYLLSPAAHEQVNVILHVLPPGVGPSLLEALDVLVHSALALAADLAEHDGVREHGEALRALGQVQVDG